MNSVEKGNRFEDKVYENFKTLLENDKLHVNSTQSNIYKRKNTIQMQDRRKLNLML